MRCPHLPFVGATDASGTYGHGACVAAVSLDRVRALARLSTKAGDYVTLPRAGAAPAHDKLRLGKPHVLDLSLSEFHVVLSVQINEHQHINLEEGRAFLKYLRWVLRSSGRFGHRLVVLVDSKVWLCAVTKGRSGSCSLNRLLQRTAALVMASGMVLHLIYVPSEYNPSDWPSRGGPHTWPAELRKYRLSTMHKIKRPLCERFQELRRTLPSDHPIFASSRSRVGTECGYDGDDESGADV